MGFVPNNWVSGDLISAAKANNTDTQFAQSIKYSEINRQIVVEGAVSSADGETNFITGSTTALTAWATASTGEPLILSFANGNSTLGGLNYDIQLTTDSSWTGLSTSNTNFLFFETSTAGVVTSSHTIIPPQYGNYFDTTYNSLIHFDGTGGATTITDNYGNIWTANGTAALSTVQFQFGTASLTLPGSAASYVETTNITSFGLETWTLEGWFYLDSTAADRTIIKSKNTYGFDLRYNSVTGHLIPFLAGSTTANDINSTTGSSGTTVITKDAWHSWAITYNSSTYTLWVDGLSDATIVSATRLNNVLGGIHHGSTANPFSGYIDEFRFTKNVYRYVAAYIPSTSSFTSDVHFFNKNKMKMYYGDPTAWTEKIRLFVGEVITDATKVTYVFNYAVKGIYDSGWFAVSANSNYCINHNMGLSKFENLNINFYFSPTQINEDANVAHDVFTDGASQWGHFSRENRYYTPERNTIYFGFNAFVQFYKLSNHTSGYYRVVVKRTW